MIYVPSLSIQVMKYSLNDVESWKNPKDHEGVLFSRGSPSLGNRANIGFLKLNPKSTMVVDSCGNNLVLTAVQGKGLFKNKNESKFCELETGNTIIVPQGSSFSLRNRAVKYDFILQFVKLI